MIIMYIYNIMVKTDIFLNKGISYDNDNKKYHCCFCNKNFMKISLPNHIATREHLQNSYPH